MAGNEVTGLIFVKFGFFVLATLGALRATSVEFTALRGICGAGKVTLKNDTVHFYVRIRNGNCRKQSLGIGVHRICKQVVL